MVALLPAWVCSGLVSYRVFQRINFKPDGISCMGSTIADYLNVGLFPNPSAFFYAKQPPASLYFTNKHDTSLTKNFSLSCCSSWFCAAAICIVINYWHKPLHEVEAQLGSAYNCVEKGHGCFHRWFPCCMELACLSSCSHVIYP